MLNGIFRIYFQLISWFKSKYGIGFLYSAYRYCTYFFALGIHCCERISLSWSLFICYTHRFVITVDDWVTWLYRDRHDYDPINGLIVTSKSYIDWILSYLRKIWLLLYRWLIKLLFIEMLFENLNSQNEIGTVGWAMDFSNYEKALISGFPALQYQ